MDQTNKLVEVSNLLNKKETEQIQNAFTAKYLKQYTEEIRYEIEEEQQSIIEQENESNEELQQMSLIFENAIASSSFSHQVIFLLQENLKTKDNFQKELFKSKKTVYQDCYNSYREIRERRERKSLLFQQVKESNNQLERNKKVLENIQQEILLMKRELEQKKLANKMDFNKCIIDFARLMIEEKEFDQAKHFFLSINSLQKEILQVEEKRRLTPLKPKGVPAMQSYLNLIKPSTSSTVPNDELKSKHCPEYIQAMSRRNELLQKYSNYGVIPNISNLPSAKSTVLQKTSLSTDYNKQAMSGNSELLKKYSNTPKSSSSTYFPQKKLNILQNDVIKPAIKLPQSPNMDRSLPFNSPNELKNTKMIRFAKETASTSFNNPGSNVTSLSDKKTPSNNNFIGNNPREKLIQVTTAESSPCPKKRLNTSEKENQILNKTKPIDGFQERSSFLMKKNSCQEENPLVNEFNKPSIQTFGDFSLIQEVSTQFQRKINTSQEEFNKTIQTSGINTLKESNNVQQIDEENSFKVPDIPHNKPYSFGNRMDIEETIENEDTTNTMNDFDDMYEELPEQEEVYYNMPYDDLLTDIPEPDGFTSSQISSSQQSKPFG